MRHSCAFALQAEREHRLCAQRAGAPPEAGSSGRNREALSESHLSPGERSTNRIVHIIKTLADLLRTSPNAGTAVADTKKEYEDKLKAFINAIAGVDDSHATGTLTSTPEPLPSAPPLVLAPPTTLPLVPTLPPGGSGGLVPPASPPSTEPPAPEVPSTLAEFTKELDKKVAISDGTYARYEPTIINPLDGDKFSMNIMIANVQWERDMLESPNAKTLAATNPDLRARIQQRLQKTADILAKAKPHVAMLSAREKNQYSNLAGKIYANVCDDDNLPNDPAKRQQREDRLNDMIRANQAEIAELNKAYPHRNASIGGKGWPDFVGTSYDQRLADLKKAIPDYESKKKDPYLELRGRKGAEELAKVSELEKGTEDGHSCWLQNATLLGERTGTFKMPRYAYFDGNWQWKNTGNDSWKRVNGWVRGGSGADVANGIIGKLSALNDNKF